MKHLSIPKFTLLVSFTSTTAEHSIAPIFKDGHEFTVDDNCMYKMIVYVFNLINGKHKAARHSDRSLLKESRFMLDFTVSNEGLHVLLKDTKGAVDLSKIILNLPPDVMNSIFEINGNGDVNIVDDMFLLYSRVSNYVHQIFKIMIQQSTKTSSAH